MGKKEDVLEAIIELCKEEGLASSKKLIGLTNIKNNITAYLNRLIEEEKIERVGTGIYKLVYKQPQEPEKDKLELLLDSLNELPELVTGAIESIIELSIEPEIEIMNMIERRNKRIADLEVLLSKSKLDLSNSRAKIQELLNNINRLRALKNKVIPETKILIKENA